LAAAAGLTRRRTKTRFSTQKFKHQNHRIMRFNAFPVDPRSQLTITHQTILVVKCFFAVQRVYEFEELRRRRQQMFVTFHSFGKAKSADNGKIFNHQFARL
jgi:hypothetical protein